MEDTKSLPKKGENLKFIKDYNLFDLHLLGLNGIFCKVTESGKYLICVPENGEWCEVDPSFVKRTRPGFVSKKNREFCSRVREMVYTYGT